MPYTFKHSGDLGDIIFSLPVIRALGGGILYLDPNGGQSEPLVNLKLRGRGKTRLSAASIESLRPLLLLQDYVIDVRCWNGEAVNYNLDTFRAHTGLDNVADWHLRSFDLPGSHRNTPWLRVDQPTVIPQYPVVISRSVRNIGNHDFWENFLHQYRHLCVFVGLPKEHEIFEYSFDVQVPYHPTPTILDLARVVAGCQQFVSNASFANALAEAMKKPKIMEVYRIVPNAIFEREGAQYV